MQNAVNAQRGNTTDSLKFNVFNYISACSNKKKFNEQRSRDTAAKKELI